MVTLSFTIFSGQKNYNRAHMLFQVLCGFEPIFYTTHPNEESFKNRFINYISKLSLLIYIIHENIILRTYFRPAMWNYVYKRFGYSDVIQWVFIISFIIFIFGILCSILYVLTLQRFLTYGAKKFTVHCSLTVLWLTVL